MLDENGYWVPDDPQLQQMNRQMSSAGGVEPAQPEPQTNLDDYPGSPDKMGLPASPPTSVAQQTLKDRYGIGTFGSAADAAKRAAEAYRGGVDQYESATHQGMPQQYGTAEPTGQDNGPLDPAQAADKFIMENNDTSKEVRRVYTTPQQQLEKNAAYAARTAADQKARFESRNALREQGAMNRAASREKDADMWAQFRDMGAMQGAAPNARFSGGPMAGAQNVGGAILLPGMGASPYGRHGYGAGLTPEQADLQRARLAESQRYHDMLGTLGAGKLDQYGKKTQAAIDAEAGRQSRHEDQVALKNKGEAEKAMAQMSLAMAELNRRYAANKEGGDIDALPPTQDPHTGKTIPGLVMPKSAQAIRDRILTLNRQLYGAHKNGFYDYQLTPEALKMISDLQAAANADLGGTPNP